MDERKKTLLRNSIILLLVFVVAFFVGFFGFRALRQVSGPAKETPTKTEPATKVEKESGMVIEEDYDGQFNCISIFAKKDRKIVADYFYQLDWGPPGYFALLNYTNSKDSKITLNLDNKDNIQYMKISGEKYYCSDSENSKNANLCKKAAEKVKYWKSIMKWDERVKRILEELKNRKPEDELD